jgi:hypothetical protein
VLFLALSMGAGWFLVRAGFRVPPRERVLVGAGLGLALGTWLANLLARWIDPPLAFWLSAVTLLVAGLGLWLRNADRRLDLRAEWRPWLLFAAVLALAYVFFDIGRGLTIFDDRKNLSLISIMAAGDIPPHFYMNPDFFFSYHYGFQLFGAMLMRVGGLFPWSAFDLAKGLTGALAIGLTVVWGRRVTGRWAGGIALGFVVLFASGARWLLLLLPPPVVAGASREIALWGSAAQTAGDLPRALTSAWGIDGGPPQGLPFAFVNGILQPFVLYLQAGPVSLGLICLLLLLTLYPTRSTRWSWVVLVALLALWALAAEAEYVLFAIGLALALVFLWARRKDSADRVGLRSAFAILGLSAGIALLQGGTLTEMARSIVSGGLAAPSTTTAGLAGFSLTSVPAIVSSHLGELRLSRPGEVALGVVEIGAALLLAPTAAWMTLRGMRRRNLLMLSFGLSTFAGFLVPMLVRYEVDRDITRLTHYALVGWILLAAAPLAAAWRKGNAIPRAGILATGFVLVFGGLVIAGPLLTAMPRAAFGDRIRPLDAAMTRALWDGLEPGSLVMDSETWRAVAVTGRLTRSSRDGSTVLEEWRGLVALPMVATLAREGYDYVYVDESWWDKMPAAARDSFGDACTKVVAERLDDGPNGFRRLFDIRACPDA